MFPAFKEWQTVVDALASGSQSILIRKGGISEGIAGFAFKFSEFLLFPTRYHNQAENVRVPAAPQQPEWQPGDIVPIQYAARLISCAPLNYKQQLDALAPLHVWTSDCLAKRFDYTKPGLPAGAIQAALVRVFKLPQPVNLSYEQAFSGCKSWIEIPVDQELLTRATPVIDDEAFAVIEHQWAKFITPPEPHEINA